MGKTLKLLRWTESFVLVALFLSLLLIAVAQVVLRNTIGSGIAWGDDVVRMAVLWITMVGAMVAVGQRGHIKIDILERFSSEKIAAISRRVANFIAAGICLVFTYYSCELLISEFQYRSIGIGLIPSWVFVTIFPISGLVMSVRYVTHLFIKAEVQIDS